MKTYGVEGGCTEMGAPTAYQAKVMMIMMIRMPGLVFF